MCLPEKINKTKYNLCYTNASRKKINKEMMDQAVAENRKGKKTEGSRAESV